MTRLTFQLDRQSIPTRAGSPCDRVRILGVMVGLVGIAVGLSTSADDRLPIPDAALRAKTLADVKGVFAAQLAEAKKPEQWKILADTFLKTASESKKDPAAHFVLLVQSLEAAANAGDFERVEKSIDELTETYNAPPSVFHRIAITRSLASVTDPKRRKPVLERGLEFLSELVGEEEFTAASDVAKELAEPIRLARAKELSDMFASLRSSIDDLRTAKQAATAAQDRLKSDPKDAAAHLDLGKYLALRGFDWREAATHLAAGSDAAWSATAKLELASPTTPVEQVSLGEAWLALADKAEAKFKLPLQRRGARWLRTSLPGLTGLSKIKVERRLAELPAAVAGSIPSVAAPPAVVAGPPAEKVVIVNVEYGLNNTWKDVTEFYRKALAADPYAPFQIDDRSCGDPVPGQFKLLQVTYSVDGKRFNVSIDQRNAVVVPPIPDEGVPARGASRDFKLLAVRYGAGLTWLDVTREFADKLKSPRDSLWWGGIKEDPWFGGSKNFAVWFEFQGRRYVRIFGNESRNQLLK